MPTTLNVVLKSETVAAVSRRQQKKKRCQLKVG